MHHPNPELLCLAASIVSAHVGNNEIGRQEVPNLIRVVYETLAEVDRTQAPAAAAAHPVPRKPHLAHPTDSQLVCVECGMKMKMLKRHLLTVHGLTPEAYIAKHRLSADTPMVTSDYAALRSQLARASGLGKRAAGKRRS